MQPKNNSGIYWPFFLFLSGFLLIPLANVRPFVHLPLYPLDFLYFVIILRTLLTVSFSELLCFCKSQAFLVAVLILAGSFLAVLSSGVTLTEVGLIKSWIFLPVVTFSLFFFTQKESNQIKKNFLSAWAAGVIFLTILSLWWSFQGAYTFDHRLVGGFSSPNFLGYFLFPAGVLFWYSLKFLPTQYRAKKFLGAILFLGWGFVLWSTGSQGALLAALGSMMACILTSYSKIFLKGFWYSTILAVFFLPFFLVFFNEFSPQSIEGRSSLASRIMIWKSAATVLKENSLLGIGAGNFQQAYLVTQAYFSPFLEWAVPEPHNIFLAFWLQGGLVGISALALGIFLIVKNSIKGSENKETPVLEALFLGTLMYGIFDTPFLGNALAFVGWGTFWILLVAAEKGDISRVQL